MNDNVRMTPLYPVHQSLGATMVTFAGYQMPVRYPAGIIAEHLHTRTVAGLFDVSHMGFITIAGGEDCHERFERLVPSDVRALPPGGVRYSLLLNESGGVIDDLMVMRPGHDTERRELWLIVNAAGKERDFQHIQAEFGNHARVELHDERALLALQGPKAAGVLAAFCSAPSQLRFMQCGRFDLAGIGECIISRTGYTGEDGFEISLPAEWAENLAQSLLNHADVQMIGLGARDSLRLEAGLPLYGHDLDETTTPVEAGLSWVVGKRRREQGGYVGSAVINRQLADGASRQRVGLRPLDRTIARDGTEIQAEGRRVGIVTSGGFSPSLSAPIAMGYLDSPVAAVGIHLDLIVRGKPVPAAVVALPFVPHRYYR